MKKELYEKISNRIYELVPRLKELSFGCKFLYESEWNDNILTFVCSYLDTGRSVSVCHLWDPDSESTINNFKKEDCKIIGHPITLEDVLEVINNKKKNRFFLSDSSLIWSYPVNKKDCESELKIQAVWSKRNKPLSEQSDELGEFLEKILF